MDETGLSWYSSVVGTIRTLCRLPAGLTAKHLLAVLVALSTADALVSRFLVEHGFGYEGNLLLRDLSSGNFMLIKLGGAMLIALILWHIYQRKPRVAVTAAVYSVLFFTGIVYWNLGILIAAQ